MRNATRGHTSRASTRGTTLLLAVLLGATACQSDRITRPEPNGALRASSAFRVVSGWTTKAPMPVADVELATASVNGILYALTRSGTFAYDPASNAWTQRAPSLHPRTEHGAAAINGLIYVAGGLDAVSYTLVGAVDVYDPSTDQWRTVTTLPTPRYSPAVATVNGVLYVLGGSSTDASSPSALATVETYDPVTGIWGHAALMPTPRSDARAVAVNGLLYVLGGVDNNGAFVATVDVYNPATSSWTTKVATMPTPRAAMAADVIAGLIYTAGGAGNCPSTTCGQLQVYDPAADRWSTGQSMPTPRALLAGVAINHVLYTVGGADATGKSTGIVEAFTPWLQQLTVSAATQHDAGTR